MSSPEANPVCPVAPYGVFTLSEFPELSCPTPMVYVPSLSVAPDAVTAEGVPPVTVNENEPDRAIYDLPMK
jgi:hypothetical protein